MQQQEQPVKSSQQPKKSVRLDSLPPAKGKKGKKGNPFKDKFKKHLKDKYPDQSASQSEAEAQVMCKACGHLVD